MPLSPIDDKSNALPMKITGHDEVECADVRKDANGDNRLFIDNGNPSGGPGGLVTLPSVQFLKDGSSKAMNVDGSGTPVEFSFTPSSSVFFVKSVTLFMLDPGKLEEDTFGAEAALTNGLQLEVITNGGTETEIVNLQDNTDITLSFIQQNTEGGNGGTSWMNDTDWFRGTLTFDLTVRLDSAQNDEIKFTVRDDLTGLKVLRAAIFAWEVQ